MLRMFKTTLRKKSKVVGLAVPRYEDLQSYGNEAGTPQRGKKSEPIKPWRAQKSSGKLWELTIGNAWQDRKSVVQGQPLWSSLPHTQSTSTWVVMLQVKANDKAFRRWYEMAWN